MSLKDKLSSTLPPSSMSLKHKISCLLPSSKTPITKEKVSSPLAADPSLLHDHLLPPQLLPALEYTSARLARQSLHLTLIVTRRDYQHSPLGSPALGSPATTPSKSRFARHLHLPRRGSRVQLGPSSPATPASSMPTSPRSVYPCSPPYTPLSLDFSRAAPQQLPLSPRSPMWPLTPMTPLSPPLPKTPLSPPWPMTPSTDGGPSPSYLGISPTPQHGVRLIYRGDLEPEAERALQAALAKAGRKYGGAARLAPALSTVACGSSSKALFNNSVGQGDVLFSSSGLTVVAPDRLYSLKAALSSYARTGARPRLEEAVDELRRYVLADGKVQKPLLRSYDWLGVSDEALADLDGMYRCVYGGSGMQGDIDDMPYFPPVPEAALVSAFSDDEDDDDSDGDDEDKREESGCERDKDGETEYHDQDSGVYVQERPDSPTLHGPAEDIPDITTTTATPVSACSASPKMPLLRLQTSFAKTRARRSSSADDDDTGRRQPEGEEDGAAVTALPEDDEAGQEATSATNHHQPRRCTRSTSIDQLMLSPTAAADHLLPPPSRDQDIPVTPNGYDDISPITRGEWGLFLVNQGFRSARTVAVTTC
ncbi:hypothetical protein ISF_01945 [Cordyceps fumosorosea ARSEF 2679]|uniref:DUF7582 domain-containing protein n=1 Tax=Cordyceps fumosorosea (strain ARSEF 2679) TaxID=1081104 RepID=A0A162LJG5_CORFA|nr:hypothetical protein ISF_01945 [Cordyceps fumosorosea ARSEF 2679]OAA71394.1 hypothetical protein ISF_01945 [Cordyceps fumosorosea ARSEF 2679]